MDERSKALTEHTTRVVECSSKFSHDISGKVHIVQFCLDEILESRPELEKDAFFSKMASGVEQMSDILLHYRATLQDEVKLTHCYNLMHHHEKAMRLLKVYAGEKALSLRIKCLDNTLDELFNWQMGEVLFAFYSLYFEFLEKGKINQRESQLTLSYLDSDDGRVKLEFEGILFTQKDIDHLVNTADYHEKTMRRKLGFELLGPYTFEQQDSKVIITFNILQKGDDE